MLSQASIPIHMPWDRSLQAIRHWFSWPRLWIVFGMLATAPMFFNRAYVPDEIWFRDDAAHAAKQLAHHSFLHFVFTQDNHLGYGAIYWISYVVLGLCFKSV